MNSESTKASIAAPSAPVVTEARSEQEAPKRVGEGLGVFRALLLTALFYIAFGAILWLSWHAFVNWRAH